MKIGSLTVTGTGATAGTQAFVVENGNNKDLLIITDDGSLVFNTNGADANFTIKGDIDQSLFITDASTDNIGIGTSSPLAKLHLEGGATTNDVALKLYSGIIETINVTKTAADADIVIRNGQGRMELSSDNVVLTSDDGGFSEAWIDMTNTANSIGFGSNNYIEFTAGVTTFNPIGGNNDFVIEGDTNTNLFYSDASADGIGFGTSTPDALVEINGGQMYVAEHSVICGTTTATIDFESGNNAKIDLQPASGTVTVTLSNPRQGAWYTVEVIQGTGLYNIVWPGTVRWPGGVGPTITATNDAIDLIRFYYDGTNYLGEFAQAYE